MSDRHNDQSKALTHGSLPEMEHSDCKGASPTKRSKRIRKHVAESPSCTKEGQSAQNSQKGFIIDKGGRRRKVTFVLSEVNLEINKNRKFSDVLNSVIQKFAFQGLSTRSAQDNEGSDDSVAKYDPKNLSPSTLCEASSCHNGHTDQSVPLLTDDYLES